jgi:GNAT superfamily N-acetyltransferase
MLFADLALARRLEGAEAQSGMEYVQAQARLRPAVGAMAEAVAGGYAAFAGVGSPLSRAVGLGLNGPVAAADLDRVETFYRSRGAQAQIDLCPLADPSLRELLGQRGYRLTDFENVWLRPVDSREVFPPPAQGIRVAEAGPMEADLWAETVSRGFAGREKLTPADLDIAAPFVHMASTICFLAWADGEPAGAASVTLRRGLAALANASTRLAYRERGVQTALLHARLALAAARGCDLAAVQTKPGSASQRNVERLGFRLAYTKVTMVGF